MDLETVMSDVERRNEISMLVGNINRICVAKTDYELFSMLEYANNRLNTLAFNRYLELQQND